MFPNIQEIQMSRSRCHAGPFIIGIFILPLFINLISNDIYNAVQKLTFTLTRFILIMAAIVACGCVLFREKVFREKVKDYAESKKQSLPLVNIPPNPGETPILEPQVTPRPYFPFIDPRVREMVDCYVNEKWGLQCPEYIVARIHTSGPVPDVEAALLSTLTLPGSKVLFRRLEIGPQTENSALDELSSQITESMRRARELDQDVRCNLVLLQC